MVKHHSGKVHAVRTTISSYGVAAAGIAICRCQHMARDFAGRGRSIVTGQTGRRRDRSISGERCINSRYVREGGSQEGSVSCGIRSGVACHTIRRCHHMPRSLALSTIGYVAPVMASRARDSRRVSQSSLVEFRIQEGCVVQG